MIKIIGKVKQEFKNILTHEEEVVETLDLSQVEPIDFNPNYKLDDDEWFKLESFSQTDYFIDECRTDFSTASLNQINNNDFKHISALIITQNNKKYIQRISKSLYINKKKVISYSGEPIIFEYRNQIIINDKSDAVYFPNEDVLYFKSISKLKLIFPGIGELHREATQDEVDTFLENDFLRLEGAITNESIGEMNRKRIADIGQKFNNLPPDKKNLLIIYARENAQVDLDDNVFAIKKENDLKKVLYAMDQRYYYADIYEENRVANSVRVLS